MKPVSVNDHENFRAQARRRLASTDGEPDSADIAEEVHAELLERVRQRRKAREARRLLSILDELDREGST